MRLTDRTIGEIRRAVKTRNIAWCSQYILFAAGFKSDLCGTKYLARALEIKLRQDVSCKQLYSAVAESCFTTPSCVERCIRHAITEMKASGNLQRINDLFGFDVLDERYVSNSHLIAALCTWIRINREMEE